MHDKTYGLRHDEIELFRTQGFIGPYTAFTPEEMARFRTILTKDVISTPSPFMAEHLRYRHLDSRTVWNLCTAPQILDRISCLFGPDLMIWNSYLLPVASGWVVLPTEPAHLSDRVAGDYARDVGKRMCGGAPGIA
jgi:hypothetical protein